MYDYEGKYSKIFTTHLLTKTKHNQLTKFAIYLRDYKNQISEEINSDLLKYLNIGKYGFISEMRIIHPKEISSYFEESVYIDVRV